MLQESNMKKGPTIAAKQYHTNRQFVYRQLEKWNGDVRSLALKSRRPKTHPNAHTEQEIELIMRMYESYSNYGLAEVYKQCKRNNYTRSYGSMCKIIINIISGAGTVNDGAMLGYHKDSKVTSEHYVKAKEEEEIKLRLLELRKRAGL